jgi:hypothetical protein
MNRNFVRVGACALWTMGMAGCGAELSDTDRLQQLDRNVGLGESGSDVRAVHAYLTRFGYFPNEQLAREHPAWRPIVQNAPASADVYDDRTAGAVKQLQRRSSLPETGIVDEATRALMSSLRCGNPDGVGDMDVSNDFSYRQHEALSHSPTWSTQDFSTVEARIAEAFDTWSADTTLSVGKSSSLFPDIDIVFGDLGEGTLGRASAPNWLTGTTTITVSTLYPMYYGLDPAGIPASSSDFRSLLLHEIGHALNLGHSGIPGSIMYSGLPSGTTRRELQLDDRVGISSIYDTWQSIGDDGLDVGVGKNGDVWVTAASGNNIWKWNPAGRWDWDPTGQLGTAIAVGPEGRPYVVAPNGSIWSRSTNDPSTGTWQELSGAGCARDIGVGTEPGAPDPIPSVWIIGCGDSDTAISKYIGGSWVADLSGGRAVRIAVDDQGVPWVNDSNGGVYRYSTNDPFTGTWSQLPGLVRDIGIGGGNYAWAIGTSADPNGGGWSIHSWNEQPAGPGNKPAPELAQWRTLPGAARVIAVGPKGDPWVVNARGQIFKTLK